MNNIKITATKLTLLLFLSIPAQIIVSFATGFIPQGVISANLRNYIIPQLLYPLLFEMPYLLIAKKSITEFMPTPVCKVPVQKTLSAMFAFMFAAITLSSIYTSILDAVEIVKPIKSASFTTDNIFESVLWLIAMAVLPPILEEAVFRGAILGTMKQYMGRGAIFFSAALFALMHANFNQIPVAFCMGLILGWFAYSTGSIVVPIILHACNNLLSVGYSLLSGVLEEKALARTDLILTAAISLIGLCCAIYEIVSFAKKIKNEPKAEKGAVKAAFFTPSFIFYTAIMLGLAVLTNIVS